MGHEELADLEEGTVAGRRPNDQPSQAGAVDGPVIGGVGEGEGEGRICEEVSPVGQRDEPESGFVDGGFRDGEERGIQDEPGDGDNRRPAEPAREQRDRDGAGHR